MREAERERREAEAKIEHEKREAERERREAEAKLEREKLELMEKIEAQKRYAAKEAYEAETAKACFTLIIQPFGRAFLSWVTERRGCETDRRQFHTQSHLM